MFLLRNIVLIAGAVFLLYGCASAYVPTEKVLGLKQKMSKKDAVRIVSRALLDPERVLGICKGNGVPGVSFFDNGWEANKKDPKPKLTTASISFNANQEILSHASSGNIATQGAAGLTVSTSKRLKQFRQTIKFSDIEWVRIFYTTSVMNRICYRPDGYAEVRVSLSTGTGHWFALVINHEDLDRFIAAMMRLAPKAEMQIG